ncbi:Nucleolar protein 13 [Tilletia horrida]|nr:Nucleolar protein 13 [Tilletia horrida]
MAETVGKERKRKRDEVSKVEPDAADDASPVKDEKKNKDTKKSKKRAAGEVATEADSTDADKSEAQDAASEAEQEKADEAEEGVGDEEVLSHKERRKRRRLEKRAASLSANAGQDAGKKSVAANTGAAPTVIVESGSSSASKPVPRSQYSIWVGNLAFSTTPQRLQTWFEDKAVAGISRINMPKGARKHEYNKGFAYVDLPDETTLKYSISLSESPLDGRRLLIKDGKNFEGRPALSISAEAFSTGTEEAADKSAQGETKPAVTIPLPAGANLLQNSANAALGKFAQSTLRAQKNAPSRTLFVGNLPFAATVDGLRDIITIAEMRKLESERDRIEAMELREIKQRRREEKERKREEALKAKSAGLPKKADSDVENEDDGSEDDADSDDDADKSTGAGKEAEKMDVDSDGDAPEAKADDTDEAGEPQITGDDAEKKTKTKAKTESEPDDIGLVKIRLATFEDNPEKCKGFAFLDFASTLHATRVLINARNRLYLARKLIYQYAGEEAQRRSGGQRKAAGSDGFQPKAPRDDNRRKPRNADRPARPPRYFEAAEDSNVDAPTNAQAAAPAPIPDRVDGDDGAKKSKPTQAERAAARLAKGKGRTEDRKLASGSATGNTGRRQKPGAALANAARGKVGIVASEGKKITFE